MVMLQGFYWKYKYSLYYFGDLWQNKKLGYYTKWGILTIDMIDIHSHIIPYIDDGAEDLTDALLMAELAVESGVRAMITTPHSNIPSGMGIGGTAELLKCFHDFKQELRKKQIPLSLFPGMEIFATDQMVEKIRNRQLMSLNNSGRYLVEFDFYMRSSHITDLLRQMRHIGAIPIVAHPERYICVQNRPQIVMDWIDMGCQLQMNKGSIFGNFGRDAYYAADILLHEHKITYVASDAHSPYQRTTHMRNIRNLLCEEFSPSYAAELLEENPQRYLIDKR